MIEIKELLKPEMDFIGCWMNSLLTSFICNDIFPCGGMLNAISSFF